MCDPLLVLALCLITVSNCARIPHVLFPIKYDLTLMPYFENEFDSHFDANVVFTFKPLRHHTARTVALLAEGLNVTSFILLQKEENEVKEVVGTTFLNDLDNQLLNFDTGYELSVDRTYELHINYSGKISTDGWGLYKGSYEFESEKRFYAVTQLRPIFARRLLPCLDEPAYKAQFTLRIWRLPHYSVRSNMPLVDSSPVSLTTGRVLDTFAETPPMSTFLLALVIFDFTPLTSEDKRFTSWTVPGKKQLAEYGHRMVASIVDAMESVAGSEFPLPKLDQIALPRLNPVAMENWGMNTYREVFMLYQEGKSGPRVRQDIPRFTGHEVSHHWLGNLVTLQWWDWLWLSEMYAMYYEYYLPSQVEPSWRMNDQMVVDLVIPGLLEDSFNSSRPLTTSVSTNQEILAKFSGPTYTKGPALLRMVNHLMGQPQAEEALRRLLREKKFGNVNPKELWHIYDRYAKGLPATMETIMNSWTDQPGYPLISVNVNHSEGRVSVKQERFLVEGGTFNSPLWFIPLTYTSGVRPNFTKTQTKVWLTPAEDFVSFRLAPQLKSWLLFNIQFVGFYRVNYNQENWERLIDSLLSEPHAISELNRAQLLDDSFTLARAGHLSYAVPLRLATYLTREGCYFPWAAFLPSVNFLLFRLNGYDAYESFRAYLRHLIAPVFNSLVIQLPNSGSQLQQLNRVQIVNLACSVGLSACIQAALDQEKLINKGGTFVMGAGLEAVELCTKLEAGGSLDILDVQSEEVKIRAVPCVADKAILIRYLNRSIYEDSEAIWRNKMKAAVNKVANIDFVFSVLLDQYSFLLDRFGSKNFTDYINEVGPLLTTAAQLQKINVLRGEASGKDVSETLGSVSAGLADRLKWISLHSPSIWLLTQARNFTDDSQYSLVYC